VAYFEDIILPLLLRYLYFRLFRCTGTRRQLNELAASLEFRDMGSRRQLWELAASLEFRCTGTRRQLRELAASLECRGVWEPSEGAKEIQVTSG
jgi:hypothetical protein